MRPIVRNIAVPVCVVAIGAAAIIWNLQRTAATKRKLADEAHTAQLRANQGDANGEYELGQMHLWGRGVPQDYAQADYWYHKAADQGLAKANYAIGDLYYYGDGLDQSDSDALAWYHKAADQGDVTALDAIGVMYYYGRGVPQSYPETMVWYQKAADQGYPRAEYDIGYLYQFGLGVTRNREEANRWFRIAANRGNENAQRALGLRSSPLRPRIEGLNFLLLAVFLLLLWDSISPKRLLHDHNARKLAFSGGLGVLQIGMLLFEHSQYCLFPSVGAATAFRVTFFCSGGVFVTTFVTGIWPRSGKLLLILSGILLVAQNVSLFAIVHFNTRVLSDSVWRFVVLDSLPLGTAISTAIYLWRKRNEPADDVSTPPAQETEAPSEV